MKANIVDDVEKLLNRGDIYPITTNEGIRQLIIICPGCGKESASRGRHVYDPATVSYHPSIVHNKQYGGCGWHGWLKNGVFKSC